MRRRLFTILSALSLVLCIATCALCVRSYWQFDAYSIHRPNRVTFHIASRGGRIGLFSYKTDGTKPGEPPVSDAEDLMAEPCDWGLRVARTGEWIESWRVGAGSRHTDINYCLISDWLILLVTGALPAFWFALWSRSRRRWQVGKCRVCGYDLRATPERCPECGTASSSRRDASH
jgi:hypothetical protein